MNDAANEPVELDDGPIDTGVLHEKKSLCDQPDCRISRPHTHPQDEE